jgi:hypothetical protein
MILRGIARRDLTCVKHRADTSNLDWSVGLQFFCGIEDGEYGWFHDVFCTQFQWYF